MAGGAGREDVTVEWCVRCVSLPWDVVRGVELCCAVVCGAGRWTDTLGGVGWCVAGELCPWVATCGELGRWTVPDVEEGRCTLEVDVGRWTETEGGAGRCALDVVEGL
jgi:hypothetical protein